MCFGVNQQLPKHGQHKQGPTSDAGGHALCRDQEKGEVSAYMARSTSHSQSQSVSPFTFQRQRPRNLIGDRQCCQRAKKERRREGERREIRRPRPVIPSGVHLPSSPARQGSWSEIKFNTLQHSVTSGAVLYRCCARSKASASGSPDKRITGEEDVEAAEEVEEVEEVKEDAVWEDISRAFDAATPTRSSFRVDLYC